MLPVSHSPSTFGHLSPALRYVQVMLSKQSLVLAMLLPGCGPPHIWGSDVRRPFRRYLERGWADRRQELGVYRSRHHFPRCVGPLLGLPVVVVAPALYPAAWSKAVSWALSKGRTLHHSHHLTHASVSAATFHLLRVNSLFGGSLRSSFDEAGRGDAVGLPSPPVHLPPSGRHQTCHLSPVRQAKVETPWAVAADGCVLGTLTPGFR